VASAPGGDDEEALLIARSGESPPQSGGTYYRRQAARARQGPPAEVTTPAMRLRLLNEAVHCDELAAKADRIAERSCKFLDRYNCHVPPEASRRDVPAPIVQ